MLSLNFKPLKILNCFSFLVNPDVTLKFGLRRKTTIYIGTLPCKKEFEEEIGIKILLAVPQPISAHVYHMMSSNCESHKSENYLKI